MNDESRPNGTASEAVAASLNGTPQVDEYGLLPLCCFRAHLDGRSLGYADGVTEGRRQVQDESWSLACRIVNNAGRSVDVMAARRKADLRMREVAR